MVFGAIGLVAARQSGGSTRNGASSPEGAVTGLLAALNHDPIDAATLKRASRWLTGEERLLVETEVDRFVQLANNSQYGIPGGGLAQFAIGGDDLGFRRVGGADGVSVLEAVSGNVTLRASGTGQLQLSLDEARKRLAQQTHGAVSSIRAVTVRSGGRWYVSLFATALEYAPLPKSGGPPEYGQLAQPTLPGGLGLARGGGAEAARRGGGPARGANRPAGPGGAQCLARVRAQARPLLDRRDTAAPAARRLRCHLRARRSVGRVDRSRDRGGPAHRRRPRLHHGGDRA
jgi:hypothetical protein